MQIIDYLNGVDFAINSYYSSINHYRQEITKTKYQLNEAKQRIEAANRQLSLGDWDPDENLPYGFIDNFYGMRAKGYSDITQLEPILNKLIAQTDSVNQLSGSILQTAKQGLSHAFGNAKDWPTSQLLGSQPLSAVIRITRNQSLHYEDGKPSKEIIDCFAQLKRDFSTEFDLSKNMGGKIVFNILDWTDPSLFRQALLNIY